MYKAYVPRSRVYVRAAALGGVFFHALFGGCAPSGGEPDAGIRCPTHASPSFELGTGNTEFIAIAEDVGLMPEIGRWVMHSACEQMALWRRERHGIHLPLAINVSASQLAHADFKEDLQTAIREHDIPPRELVLEVTEHVFLKDDESTIRTMVDIAKTGVRFSIDDFGTGHASLAYLTRLPLSQLKIAQPFVERIGEGEPHTSIVQAIIAMATSLNLELIAEGVEREEQRAFLLAHGCGQVQGFLVGRPVPAKEFFGQR